MCRVHFEMCLRVWDESGSHEGDASIDKRGGAEPLGSAPLRHVRQDRRLTRRR